ncbi:MAG: PAS domain-containing protein, partial [Lachnospiraceae bacterium]|nr:PAS domain-containing protein [Lachnospiraceae bacterium]
YDIYENQIEITRVNEQYYKLAGISRHNQKEYKKCFWNHVRDDDRQLLLSIFEQAYNNPVDGAQGYIHFVREDNTVRWVHTRVYFMREKKGISSSMVLSRI